MAIPIAAGKISVFVDFKIFNFVIDLNYVMYD